MKDVFVVSAVRTPLGSFNGSLGGIGATKLGAIAIEAAVERANIQKESVNEVIMGMVLSGNTGAGPARQVCINAGVPDNSTAYAINQLCASGMRAVAEGYKSIKLGDSEVVVAGGMESMSWSPHVANMRGGMIRWRALSLP